MTGGLSVAIITHNEEEHLARTLESVSFADEIVIVDAGSGDATLEVARRFNARIFVRDWPGYGAQKNFALEQTTREWVLSLDGDECLSPLLADEIREVVSGAAGSYSAYSAPRLSLFVDRWMRHGGWYPDRQIRLVRQGHGRWTEPLIHEHLEVDCPVGQLRGDILHHSYGSISDYVRRMDLYSSLGARSAILKGCKPPGTALLAWSPVRKFLEVYVLKRGFLDGKYGFVTAVLAACSLFLRKVKIWKPESGPDVIPPGHRGVSES